MISFHVDSFSGQAADLKKRDRNSANVLAALRRDPRVSCFDMSEHPWLCNCISALKQSGAIVEDQTAAYPWLRYIVKDAA